eukprot:TRINITY_DN6044_c0_g1_i1.p1 TRINITY_DN6044_c0_g1~~TRINITY_DN6044_c0_g1_i1.p1  ORF type:complete len:1105 (+),score=195.63 TRINITY_DN6044_c0_g1_i1:45-3359(+)
MSSQRELQVTQRSLVKRALRVRLSKLQSLCRDLQSDDDSSPEAILLINGVDGQYHHGARILSNYLFRGFAGADLHQSNSTNDLLDEVFAVISRNVVHLYSTPEAWRYLAPRIASYESLKLYLLDKKTHEDTDTAEEHKIRSFIEATNLYKTVGIPLSLRSDGSRIHLDRRTVLNIEKWPLVQSYALEGFGTGGFFSMKHTVHDISASLAQVILSVDALSVRDIITNQRPRVLLNWESFIGNIDRFSSTPGQKPMVDLETIAEPLISYHSYGLSEDQQDLHSSAPLLYLGPDDYANPAYIVAELRQPFGPLRLTRTYFFSHGGKLVNVHLNETLAPLIEHEVDLQMEEFIKLSQILTTLYGVIVNSTKHSITSSSPTQSPMALFEQVFIPLATPISPAFQFNAHVSLEFEERNMNGDTEQTMAGHTFKYFGVKLVRFPVQLGSKSVHVNMAFGETYITSIDHEGHNLVLTTPFEPCLSWPDAMSKALIQSQTARFEALKLRSNSIIGKFIAEVAGDVRVIFPASNWNSLEFRLFAFQQGFVLLNPRVGSLLVCFEKDVASIQSMYDSGKTKDTLFLAFSYKEDHQNAIFPGVQLISQKDGSPDTSFAIIVPGQSQSRRVMRAQVLPAWQEMWTLLSLPVDRLEYIPYDYEEAHESVESLFSSHRKHNILTQANEEFLMNWTVDDALEASKQLKTKFIQELHQDISEMIKVHIITEFPGSGGSILVKSLISAAARDQQQLHVIQPEDNAQLSAYTPEYMVDSLRAFLGSHDFRSFEKVYAAIYIPGCHHIPTFVRQLTDLLVEESLPFAISSIAVCLCAKNLVMKYNHYHSDLVRLLLPGWAQQIVLVETFQTQGMESSNLAEFSRLLEVKTPVIKLGRDRVIEDSDLQTFLECRDFADPESARDRAICTPRWLAAESRDAIMSSLYIPMQHAFDRKSLIQLLESIICKAQNAEILYARGYVRFSESNDAYELHVWKGSNVETSVRPVKGITSTALVFFGKLIDDADLHQKLRTCFAKPKGRKAIRTEAELTSEEVDRFHRLTCELPLPEGYYYDGQRFLHYEFGASPHHPEFHRLVAEYIARENAEIERFNSDTERSNAESQNTF